MSKFQRLGVLISGRGSNMLAIQNAIEAGQLQAEIAVVISHKPEAPGLFLAQEKGLKTVVVDNKSYTNKIDYETAILEELKKSEVGLLILAGYMRIVGPTLLTAYANHMLNIHPSLLPDYKGLHAQEQALNAGVSEAGCTVHVVNEEMDAGPILAQDRVPVLDDDTVESLSRRILTVEHLLYPKAIGDYIRILKGDQS